MAENEMTYTIEDVINLPANLSIEKLQEVYRGFCISKKYNFNELDTFSENELKRDIAFEMLIHYDNEDTVITAKGLNKILDLYEEIIEKPNGYYCNNLTNGITGAIENAIKSGILPETKDKIFEILDLIVKDYKEFKYDTIRREFDHLLEDVYIDDNKDEQEIVDKIKKCRDELCKKYKEEKNNKINKVINLINNPTLKNLQEAYKIITDSKEELAVIIINNSNGITIHELSENDLKYKIASNIHYLKIPRNMNDNNSKKSELNDEINAKQIELIKQVFQNPDKLNIDNLSPYYVFDFIEILQEDITKNHEDTLFKIIDFMVKYPEQFGYDKTKTSISNLIKDYSKENQEKINILNKKLEELENNKDTVVTEILNNIKNNPDINWKILDKKTANLVRGSVLIRLSSNIEKYQYLYNLSYLDIKNEEYPSVVIDIIKQDLEDPEKSSDVCEFLNDNFIDALTRNNTEVNIKILFGMFDLMIENMEKFSYNKIKNLILNSIKIYTYRNPEENQEIINKLKEKLTELEDYKNTEINKIYNYINDNLSIENLRKSCKIINRLSGLDPNGIDSEGLKKDNLMLILINDLIKFDTNIERVLDMSYELCNHISQNPETINPNDLNKTIYNYLYNIPLDTIKNIEKANKIYNLIDLRLVGNQLDNYIVLQQYISNKETELHRNHNQYNPENNEEMVAIEEDILNAVINQTFEEERQRAMDELYTAENIRKNISSLKSEYSFYEDITTEEGRVNLINILFYKYFTDPSSYDLDPESMDKFKESFIQFFLTGDKDHLKNISELIQKSNDIIEYIKYSVIVMMDYAPSIKTVLDMIYIGNNPNIAKEGSISKKFKDFILQQTMNKVFDKSFPYPNISSLSQEEQTNIENFQHVCTQFFLTGNEDLLKMLGNAINNSTIVSDYVEDVVIKNRSNENIITEINEIINPNNIKNKEIFNKFNKFNNFISQVLQKKKELQSSSDIEDSLKKQTNDLNSIGQELNKVETKQQVNVYSSATEQFDAQTNVEISHGVTSPC